MGKRKLGALEKVDADLYVFVSLKLAQNLKLTSCFPSPNLQHKIKRDPKSYTDDFRTQYYQYLSYREIFLANPASISSSTSTSTSTGGTLVSLRDLIEFIAHVADCYPELTVEFPGQLIEMLSEYHLQLEGELREKIVGSLVLLRRKDVIDSAT